jgi:predicted GNAT family acetyltransferase
MVVGVGTLPSERKKGLAGSLVAKLCEDFLNEGKQFLCLFYDNPEAGSIYRKIGFTELGNYILLKRGRTK